MKRRRIWLPIVLLLALGGGAGLYYSRSGDDTGPRYETIKVTRGTIMAKLMAAGSLSPLVTVQVGSQVSGRIKELMVDYNSLVKKGQVIARIDPQLFQAALEQSRANMLAAEANLAKARVQADEAGRQHRRTKTLAGRKLVAPADEETAQANADSAQAQVVAARAALEQARAALNQARVNLAYTTIQSPISGVVISRNVDVGQTVAASLQAPTLFTIAEDLSKMQVHANVAESDIGRVENGMTITFTVDAYPREQFHGKVQQIRNAPQTVQNVVTYDVVIDVANPDLRLRPGMTANATFVYAQKDQVLRAPNAALRFQPPRELWALTKQGGAKNRPRKAAPESHSEPGAARKGEEAAGPGARPGSPGVPARAPAGAMQRQVWVLRDGQPRPVTIQVGITDGSVTEVLAGALSEGDELLVDMSDDKPGGEPGPKGFGPPRGRGVIRRL